MLVIQSHLTIQSWPQCKTNRKCLPFSCYSQWPWQAASLLQTVSPAPLESHGCACPLSPPLQSNKITETRLQSETGKALQLLEVPAATQNVHTHHKWGTIPWTLMCAAYDNHYIPHGHTIVCCSISLSTLTCFSLEGCNSRRNGDGSILLSLLWALHSNI